MLFARRAAVLLGIGLAGVLGAGGCELAGGRTAVAPTGAAPALDPALLDRPLYTFGESEVDAYLRHLRATEPDLQRRVITLGRKNLGQPYDIYLLGEFPFEAYDPDPIYCLSKSDCVTFCEHMYAMALGSDWWSFLRTLQRLRYRDGTIGMLTRNHYTIADWDRNNSYLFEDLTPRLGGGQAAVPLHEVVRRARFFAPYGIGQDLPDEPVTDCYIPKASVPMILSELRAADFVNIIRGDEAAQSASHTGLIAVAADGTVDFLHSAKPAVREQPLLDYLEKDERCLGIKILRLRPDADALMRQTLEASPQATEVSEAALNTALARRRNAAPATAQPAELDWRQALHLQAYRLEYDAPVDAELQAALVEIDRRVGEQLAIPDADRAVGVLDLAALRLAMVHADDMFYAASVPKICILLAYFETHPEAATALPPDVQYELGRMIKVSDNEMAAKYGQIVGLEKVQALLNSARYRFYDPEHGGGLWYGKHYNKGEPRIGDPLHDFSHGATVRQCLRYYLMLEQGRLASAAACTKMREIFATPELELGETSIVAGLQGRDVTLIRKSGTWEDWHLDTARVAHGTHVYLLAGMVHHPAGEAYLAGVAAALDEQLCGPPDRRPTEHRRIQHETPADFKAGRIQSGHVQADPPGVILACPLPPDTAAGTTSAIYESPVINSDLLFNEVVLSWNIELPPHAGFCVEARVGRRADDSWSPYLYFADRGGSVPSGEKITKFEHGYVDVDYFRSDERFDRLQYRVRAAGREPPDNAVAAEAKLRIARVTVNLSDTTGRLTSVPQAPLPAEPPPAAWQRRLPVPFRSQTVERKDIAGMICSPTSVSMVLEYRGVNRPTQEVAARAYDATFEIYGIWPHAVQTAYSYGISGYLARFADWASVEQCIANDQPLVISILAGEGELQGAPYPSTDGHLLVLTGFDAAGNVEVNDPAATTAEKGQIAYRRAELETVWMKPKGGTAYVLLANPAPTSAPAPAEAAPAEPLVDIADIDPRIVLDMLYAGPRNFTKQQLYPVARALLRESAARRLRRVQDRLVPQGLGLKVLDAYRPLAAQRKMWEIKPDPNYVADPANGSRHNRGAAVDVTLVDFAGHDLEMPTTYDDFSPAARPDSNAGTEEGRRHRQLLIAAMEAEGFRVLPSEWWHFDAPGWEQYPLLDIALTEVP
jgi:D-alanyl-D-alanine dipeptidase